jgi:KipI family sensor histidine kinase inhibitor
MSGEISGARIAPASDQAVAMVFGDEMSLACHAQVRRWDAYLRAYPPRGVRNIHPAYASLLIAFDARVRPLAELKAELRGLLTTVAAPEPTSSRQVELPTCYGGGYGPDLDEVARLARMTPAQAAACHAGAEYLVHFLGFSPGFPYLGGLPPALAVPRLATPRTRVPAGSVAVAGAQAGVYPLASPGGWRVLGRTPALLFDAEQPEPALLALGDRVRFVPIAAETYAELVQAHDPGARMGVIVPPEREPALVVEKPGFLTTVQDLGRHHFGHLGVSASGAADALALRVGNLLVGNAEGAPALEMTLVGGSFTFAKPALIALTGADMQAALDDERVPPAHTLAVTSGQTLRCGPARAGARAYLCVRGGVAVPPVLGSASTHLASGLGGYAGRALRAGDALAAGEQMQRPPMRAAVPEHILRALAPRTELRVTAGRHAELFASAQRTALAAAAFAVTESSNRMGLRLRGPALGTPTEGRLLTEGVPLGAVQVPHDGQPILVFVEHQTTGGYPQLACVIAADLHHIGQLRPRDAVRFAWVTFEEAERLLAEQESMLRRWREDG